MRYDELWKAHVERAIATADLSLDAFFRTAAASRQSPDSVERRLVEDLENNGPIFGPFMRSLFGVADGTLTAAERQGQIVGQIDGDAELKRLLSLGDLDDVINDADPEELDAVEQLGEDHILERWVATMRNTCHRCLPLHGKVMFRSQWRESGFLPETIHEGWNSVCQCSLVPEDQAGSRTEIVAPLLRRKFEGTSKRTARAVTQQDIERSLEARDKALASEEGRRTLRLLGQANATEEK